MLRRARRRSYHRVGEPLYAGTSYRLLDERTDRQRLLDFVDMMMASVCLRMPRCEERATVFVWQRRDVERADALRLLDDLVLVHADQRPEHRQLGDPIDHGHVV